MRLSVIVATLLALILVVVLLSASCTPYPQDYAAATATVMAAQSIATREAISISIAATTAAVQVQGTSTTAAVQAQTTSTAAAASVMQTAEAARIIIEATLTAAPYNAPRAGADAHTEIAQEWGGVLALFTGIAVASLVGLALVAGLQTRARIVRPGPTGQMPAMWDGRTLVEPNRMIGPTVTTPARPDWLIEIARAVHYLRTGKALPSQETQPALLTDGQADADHLLEAARVAGAASVAASMFRPDNAERGRQAKIELLRKGGANPLGLLGGSGVGVPTTRVVVTGDSAIEALARQLGDHLPPSPQLTGPAAFEAHEGTDDEAQT
ncbi:MAG: hypothetical protein JW850_08820 [Thermoflexales bacterium]|nr:hypothetical protein [Thermoflexales bacterium]